MKSTPIIAVLCGGTSPEREVSLGSGKAAAVALTRTHPTCLVTVDAEAVPAGLDPSRHLVFSTLHGLFGEDGGMQRLLDAAGIAYAGCDAAGSAVCFDKVETKRRASDAGVRVCEGMHFSAQDKPLASELEARLGVDLVFKPNCNGSSVGLCITEGRSDLEAALAACTSGEWLVEKRIRGRELTVGVLQGRPLGVVEVVPKTGLFDYSSKYTKGMTEYHAPADLPEGVTQRAQEAARLAYEACGCRDYARLDFMLSAAGDLFLLEINTLPGMKDTSLLPMSARCEGLDFTALVRELVAPACERFHKASPNT